MAVIKELIAITDNNGLSFGDYTLDQKTKKSDFEFEGAIYKIKTYDEITRLERNETLVYESVPGTTVHNFSATENKVTFQVEGPNDAQITLELEPSTEYKVFVDDTNVGKMKTNLSGKLNISIEINQGQVVSVKIVKL